MAEASHLSRVCPAILSVAGIAAVCGIYAVYTAYAKQSATSGLRRSNAVHRPRREPTIDWMRATPDAPLGTLINRRGDDVHVINIATNQFPTADGLRQMFPPGTEELRREFEDTALECVLTACFVAAHYSESWNHIESLGLQDLIAAMAARDEDHIRAQSVLRLTSLLHLDSDDQILSAVTKFLASDTYATRRSESDSEDDSVDPGETEEMDLMDPTNREPSQGLRGLLYYIAEEDAKRKAYEHRGIHCEECGEMPIRGIRWHCLNCPDFDLCASCELRSVHPKTHVFAKIKIPLPVLSQPTQEYRLWYPGDPRKLHGPLEVNMKKKLCREHGFSEPSLDALYDQFTCIANVPWTNDPIHIEAAIDKRAFNKALSCEKWSSKATSNPLYDRMFAFYDTDGNALIGFEEFVSGLAYLRGPERFASLERTLKGYDINGDGSLDREDFIRLLRAKFAIQQQLVNDSIEAQETEQTHNALDILRSSQPISSIFSQEDIPLGEVRLSRGKEPDSFGDMRPMLGTKTFLDDEDPWPQTNGMLNRRKLPDHERLRRHFSRFEELLHGSNTEDQRDIMDQVDGLSPLFVPEEDGDSEAAVDDMESLSIDEVNEELSEPFIQDILWKLAEGGFNEMLDHLFALREQQDRQAIESRTEREKWRKEIDATIAEERHLYAKLEAGAPTDPLMATAKESRDRDATSHSAKADEVGTAFTSGIVPTDWESLERREQGISDAPLDDLLDATGYGVREESETSATTASPRQAHTSSSSIWNGATQNTATSPLRTVTSNSHIDSTDVAHVTLPQSMHENEKDVSIKKAPSLRHKMAISHSLNTTETSPERPPPKARLQELAKMDIVDQRVQEYGGPGKLTYAEIEAKILEGRPELGGLIKSWLEWASF